VIHENLFSSIVDNGYDAARPLPGIAVHYKSPAKVQANLTFNESFTDIVAAHGNKQQAAGSNSGTMTGNRNCSGQQ
jgi:hypothetical protein